MNKVYEISFLILILIFLIFLIFFNLYFKILRLSSPSIYEFPLDFQCKASFPDSKYMFM